MAQAKPIPEGFSAVTPHLVCAGARAAIDFYKRAFDAVEICTMPMPDGKTIMHAEIAIGGARLMLADEFPDYGSVSPKALNGSPVVVHLYVADVDRTVAQAQAAGATVTVPPSDMFWGDRYAKLIDPFGHRWSVATHTRDVTPEEMAKAAAAAMAGG